MAAKKKARLDLTKLAGAGIITILSSVVKLKVRETGKTLTKSVSMIGSILKIDSFVAEVQKVNADIKSLSDLLKLSINDKIESEAKATLRVMADPVKAVNKAVDKMIKQFAGLSPEQAEAMRAILISSMANQTPEEIAEAGKDDEETEDDAQEIAAEQLEIAIANQ